MGRYKLRPAWHQRMHGSISFRGAYDAFASSIVHAYEPARRVLTAYTGALVRLRRASDDAEANFGAVAATGELNVAAIAAWAGGASYVVTVYDQKGSDNVTQAVAANQPLFTASAQNGHAGMTFDGSNDYLQGVYTNGGALSQPFNVYTLAKLDASAVNDGNSHRIIERTSPGGQIFMGQYTSATPDSFSIYAGTVLDDGDSDANWHLWTALFNGGSSQLWLDSVSKVSGNAGASNPSGLSFGADGAGNSPWKGLALSVIIADPAFSDADRIAVQNILNTYWSIF